MDGITCDMCGKALLADEEVRYVAEIKVYAAYDVMEMTSEDLKRRDVRAEIRKTLESMEGREASELEEEVAAFRTFDLCPSCRRKFLEGLPRGQCDAGE